MKKILFYDCEIINPIRCKSDWRDYGYLGISVIGAYASWLTGPNRLQAFTADRFEQFQWLVDQAEEIVGFNSIGFDDPLCQAQGLTVQTTYDLMIEVRRAAGEPISGPCTPGYNLARLAEVNFGHKKTGIGKEVPDLWGRGECQRVIDYCLNDVELLRVLYEFRGCLKDPVMPGRTLRCDDRLIDWSGFLANGIALFGDRIFGVNFEDRLFEWANTSALAQTVSINFLGCVRLNFPLYLHCKKFPTKYIGLPFWIEPCPEIQLDPKNDPNLPDFNPIPF